MDHNHWMSSAGETAGYLNAGYLPPHHAAAHEYAGYGYHHDAGYPASGPIGHASHHHHSIATAHPMNGGIPAMTSGMFHHHHSEHQFATAAGLGLSGSGYSGTPTSSTPAKRKRKRIVTPTQRSAANVRERKRMYNLNEAFDSLRKKVPTFAYEKRLSRIETLRLAITYISFLGDVVEGKDPNDVNLPKNGHSAIDTIQRLLAQSEQCSDTDSSGTTSPRNIIPYGSM
ncbi:uncharacterized protein LOC141912075 [Tubulanus polymorphus]|uniref:uncharacterized protein LOC141912075 n=1 Tax=Tubulanus polymorphus TaxID=672921 RepID=UPI003DA5E3D8